MTISLFNPENKGRVIGIKPVRPKPQSEASEQSSKLADSVMEEANQQKDYADQIVREAEEKSDRLLKETQEKIKSLQNDWEEEKVKLEQATKEDAFNKGFESGEQDAFKQYESLIEKAHTIIDQATQDYYAKIADSEETILHLSLKAASKIMNQTLTERPETFLPIVRAVIDEGNNTDELRIYVHPDQYEEVLAQKSELQLILDHQAELTIYPKTNLQPFQCYMESSYGRVDVSIDSQLEELRTKLFRLLEEAE
ncbi:flagellar assembly protein FliH [Pontibacillus sp. HN14]|uniref:flagellar assembly protein FliH n=1 Tax=Pontibacillus sp. HN14 TaxID=2898421 RepID=UPI001E471BF0